MTVLTVDFETYYDKHFSLSKMTTEEYIRDELFEVVGVSVAIDDGDPVWFSGTKAATKRFLDQYDWANSVALAHNAMFDMAILSWHFDIRPKKIADTLSMLRAIDGPDAGNSLAKAAERYELGAKGDEVIHALGKGRIDFTPMELVRYGEYCCNDTALTYKLFEALVPLMPKLEMALIDLTIRMFTEPALVLDKDVLTKHLDSVRAKKETLMAAVQADKSVLMSNPQLAALLVQLKVVPPQKVSPTTGKLTWAFGKNDEMFKALLDHPSPKVQAVVAARMGVKSTLEETRTERFIGIADRGTLPVPLRYYAAHTGRWGGDDKLNLQNLPRGSALKKAILAPEGYTFIDCDSSQIEARTLAWLAGQDDLVEFFRKNNDEIAAGVEKEDMQYDPYRIMAAEIYRKSVSGVTEHERLVGKVAILGAGYGMGAAKFQAQLKTFNVHMPLEECQYIISVYRQTYPMIPALWRQGNDVLEALMSQCSAPFGKEGAVAVDLLGIRLPNSMYIRYPNLRKQAMLNSNHTEVVYDTKKGRATIPNRIYGGKVTENVCQALARIIIGEQMLMVARRLKVVMTVHDAVGSLVRSEEAVESREFVEHCMRITPKWAVGLPLNCESKMGASYGG
jgi:DNA polymerase